MPDNIFLVFFNIAYILLTALNVFYVSLYIAFQINANEI